MSGIEQLRREGATFRGGVFSQTNPDRPSGARTERLCNGCRQWYLKSLGDCPSCGTAPPEFNPGARKRILDDHLLGQAENADRNR